ncbi:hypothetical protein ACTTBJ_20830, partial [Shewanella frigidimarina]|uniref:hypothetical protein n=1 Tax=Shewanella frigidimarina TaxID=56812 RepID=UPI003FA11AD3
QADAVELVLEQAELMDVDYVVTNKSLPIPIRVFGQPIFFSDELNDIKGLHHLASINVKVDMPYVDNPAGLSATGHFVALKNRGIVSPEIIEEYIAIKKLGQSHMSEFGLNEYSDSGSGLIWSIKQAKKGSVDFQLLFSMYLDGKNYVDFVSHILQFGGLTLSALLLFKTSLLMKIKNKDYQEPANTTTEAPKNIKDSIEELENQSEPEVKILLQYNFKEELNNHHRNKH